MDVCATLFMVPLGLQEATCAIIGNCIGSNNVPLAKRYFKMINYLTLAVIATICLATGMGNELIASAFTDDEEVYRITSNVILFMACYFSFDGLQGYLQGPIRALGLQRIASFFAIGCCYGIGIPMACFFALKLDMGVMGLQMGIALALFAQLIVYLVILIKSDW